jgi:hypothetical protein
VPELPRITPLAPTRLPHAFDHPDWIFELKHDGWRICTTESPAPAMSKTGLVVVAFSLGLTGIAALTIRRRRVR